MRGRPPKPTTIAILQGDPGKRRRYKIEPVAPDKEPVCPDWLDETAKAEWQHTVGVLRDMGLLSSADQTAIACYCEAWSRYRQAAENVQKYGAVILSPEKKFPMVSPYHSIMRTAMKDLLALSDRFGLTPSARARLGIDADKATDTENDKWRKLVG